MAARIAQRAGDDGPEQEIDSCEGTRMAIDFLELSPTIVTTKVTVVLDHCRGTVQKHLGSDQSPGGDSIPVASH